MSPEILEFTLNTLTSKIRDQSADWTAKQILAETLLRSIVELICAGQMIGPKLSKFAELEIEKN